MPAGEGGVAGMAKGEAEEGAERDCDAVAAEPGGEAKGLFSAFVEHGCYGHHFSSLSVFFILRGAGGGSFGAYCKD